MNQPSYKEQFDKLTTAYTNNLLDHTDTCACFIGTLLNGHREWYQARSWHDEVRCITEFSYRLRIAQECIKNEAGGLYTIKEIMDMEDNFMEEVGDCSEESIFRALDSTLDMLRNIHESKGEIIESLEFKQRQLI